MISIQNISVAFPDENDSVEEIANTLSLNTIDVRFFKRFLGLNSFYFDPSLTRKQLLVRAVSQLCEQQPKLLTQTQFLAHCTTLPTTSIIGKDDLEEIATNCFDVRPISFSLSMGHCATGLLSLDVAASILESKKFGIVLVGEKAFHPNIRLIKNTTIMGEAAVAFSVRLSDGGLKILRSCFRHDGRKSISEGRPSSQPENALNNDDYYQLICETMRDAVRGIIAFENIDWVIPHNVNLTSWVTISKLVGIDRNRVFTDNINKYGHCFGADPFINVCTLFNMGVLDSGNTLLLVSAGLGATVCAALIHVEDTNWCERK